MVYNPSPEVRATIFSTPGKRVTETIETTDASPTVIANAVEPARGENKPVKPSATQYTRTEGSASESARSDEKAGGE